jgi:hypothetical protein
LANPDLTEDQIKRSLVKPMRGASMLKRRQDKLDAAATEKEEKSAVKAWANYRCRWPEKHVCLGGLEAAHLIDASLGGPMDRTNLVTLCAWIHRRGPESIHGKQLRVEAEVAALGSYGALAFYRKGEDGEFYCIAREVRPFQVARD